jgi:hypothetical protein
VALVDGTAIEGHSPVEGRELLYRNIKRVYWKQTNDGFYLGSMAFTDPDYRISVYRAHLCGNDPSHAQEQAEDYVRSLVTEDVRNIDTVVRGPSDAPIERHRVDVAPAPKHDDPSHAEIYTDPEITSPNVFRRLQVRLACLSEWAEHYGP